VTGKALAAAMGEHQTARCEVMKRPPMVKTCHSAQYTALLRLTGFGHVSNFNYRSKTSNKKTILKRAFYLEK